MSVTRSRRRAPRRDTALSKPANFDFRATPRTRLGPAKNRKVVGEFIEQARARNAALRKSAQQTDAPEREQQAFAKNRLLEVLCGDLPRYCIEDDDVDIDSQSIT